MADNQQYGPLAPKQTTAEDIRKVVANGPKALGQGSTIATSDELAKKKEEAKAKNRKVNITTPTQKISTTGGKTTTAVTTPKQSGTAVKTTNNTQQGANKFASLIQGQVSGDLFKNPAMQPIDNAKVVKQDNEATHNVASNKNDESFMNTFGRAKELKKPVDVDNALMDLYSDVRTKVENGTLASSDVTKMKQVYPEFANMGDDVLLSMIGDMASIASKNMPFNDVNMNKLKSLYPELNAASWGFDKGANENMYQAGGLREQLSATSKTDLNKKGGLGIAAEAVMNPVGEVSTLLDMGIQMIPQADNDNTAENNLKKALSKLTEEDINKYYQQYQNYIKEHGTLSKLYTTQLEGDNTVEKLWNWISGNSKQNADAGFRSWLIDRVNNDINGWAGQIVGAGDDLKDITGPNTAKMYANMPASALKTASAVTRAITNPIDTAAGLYQLFGTEEGRQALAMRYGSWEGFAKALEQDPVGVASDGLAIVEGGAGITKLGASGLSKAGLVAALSTETLGAARTTENLLKLASRLEKLASKAGAVEKTAGLASNLGVDVPIKGVINGLRQWGENGSSVMQKLAKYSANRAETGVGKILSDAKDVVKNGPINSLADILMGTATENDKLMKAASPAINKLTNNVDYKNKRKKLDIAENAVVEAGYTPKTIAEWAKAHTETLNKKWNEFKQMVKDKSDYEIDVKEILTEVKDYIKREKEGATAAQKADLRKLEVEVQDLERRGKVDMGFIENRKEHYNSSWRDSDKLKVGDVYLKGIKLIGNAMRKQQDNILGKGPEQTKKLRQEISALMDTKEDILKADLRNQKKKSDIAGGGLVESYGRLSGLGDVIGGVVGGVFGKGGEGFAQAGKGLGKLVFGKAMGKARDVDYLTKKGFEGLSKKKGLGAQKEGGLRSKFQDSRELGDLLVERDKLKKELKDEKLSKEEKEKKQKRYDDVEYAIAQKRARSGLGDKENKLTAESKKKVIDMVQKRAKDVGYVTEVVDGMEKDTQGYTDLRKKLIALEKNPGDTTAQHELFHAFFSVVDDKTKTYILDEAKKILKDSGMKDVSAEEWLAESFGIYAKRQQIKLGLIDAPKGFVAKVRDFFQRVYEYMQRFNGDRATINKLFDEILGDRQMKNGIMDLSDLLGNKEVKSRKLYSELGDNGLRNKAVYHGSPADFDKFDSSHMGEGEGNQAHGWGHYVAVNEGTARNYAELKERRGGKLAPKFTLDGKELSDGIKNLSDIEKNALNQFKDAVEGGVIEDIAWNRIINKDNSQIELGEKILKNIPEKIKANPEKKQYYDEMEADIKKDLKEYKDRKATLESLRNRVGVDVNRRNLYNLEIPDPKKADTPTGSNYLEEDKIFTKSQINKLRDKIEKSGMKGGEQLSTELSYDIPYSMKLTGRQVYDKLASHLGGKKEASKFLESLGYDGIHYFGGRDGEAYVIFNDDALQIKDHIRYKKKIGDKEVEINKDITSPEQMAKVNSKGLSVIHDFISEKQAEKALDVSKDILDKDGNAYLWTHTNKYTDKMFANFESTKDSRYKDFPDNQIAFFSNSEEMSKSYADQKSKLAPTKKFTSIDELNKYAKENPIVHEFGGAGDTHNVNKFEFSIEPIKNLDGGDAWGLYSVKTTKKTYPNLERMWNLNREDWFGGDKLGEMPKDKNEALKILKEKLGTDIKLLDNGKVEQTFVDDKHYIEGYNTKQEALAEGYAKMTEDNQYHYQGIIQDVKNPLIVDYRNPEGTKTYWNRLGSVYEFLERTDKKQLNKLEKTLDDVFGRREEVKKERRKVWDKIEEEGHRLRKESQKAAIKYNYDNPGDAGAKRELQRADFLKDSFNKYQNIVYEGFYRELTKEELAQLKDLDALNQWGGFIDLVNDYRNKYKDYDILGRNGIGIEKFLENEGFSKDIVSLAHELPTYDHALGEDIKNGKYALQEKEMTTNDYVFYALNNGAYDGVLFKNISDYGGEAVTKKGGDVLTTFKSKNFKSWDNSTPTDSKYISYKKKVSLDKKLEGLSKKDSNGLLAKGRDRKLGNDGLRYKTNISEKDSSGKKLSEGQKKFFAGSKVVDKDGNLLRVYHGTVAGDFTVFQKYGNRTSNNIASDVGFWFTPNKKGAINFAKESSWRGDNKARAEEVYLDIKNPKVYEPSEFNLKAYEERDKLIDSKYKEVYAARNEMNKYDYNHFWMGEYTHDNNVNRGIFNKLEYIYDQKGKITEADLKDIKEEYGKINWDGYYKPEIDATYEDFKNYLQAKKKYDKLNDEYLEMKHSDSYDDFKADIYKLDNKKRDKLDFALDDMDAAKKYIDNLKKEGYDGIIIKGTEYDGTTLGEGARNDQYVAFNSNQIKRITNENPTKNEDIRFKKVYHGSPADFDAFDSSHMGEGEGAQAHGWGHYVAVDENTAKRYANMRGNGEASYKGKTRQSIKDMAGLQTQEENMALGIMARMEEWGKTFEDARDSMIKDNEGYIKKLEQQIDKKDISWYGSLDYMKEKLKEAKDEIEILNRLDKKDFSKTKRNLYNLDIPDPVKKDTPTGSNYLEEKGELNNKELEKFSRKLENELGFEIRSLDYATMDDVKKMGEKLGWGDDFVNEVKEDLDAWKDGDIAGAIVKELKYGVSDFDKFLKDNGFFYLNDRNIYNGGKLYEHISKLLGSDKKASKFLESLGYDGIHYFGGRDGEAYVIFNDDSLEIKDHIRYKKGLTAKDQTQTPEFKKWFEGSKVVDKSGKPLEVYHGSRHAGFTEFKPVNSFEDGLYFFSNKRHIASYFGGGDTLWSDKGLQGKFDEAKAKGIDEVKKFAKRYFNTPQEIEVSMNHITPKEAKEFGVEPGYFYHIDDGQVASPIRINGKRTFDKPLSQKEIDDAILREVQSSVDYYGAEDKKKSQVYASYLDIKNPLEVEAKGNKFSHVLNPIDGQYHHVADIAYMAKENGYDGVIIKDVSESPEKDLRGDDYIVWDSRQIKSATDNIGTFDKNNPDIRYKKGLQKKGNGLHKKSNASILAKGRDRK